MKTLIKTIHLENGELYGTIHGNRVKVAGCVPRIEVYEESTYISTIGKGYKVKKKHYKIVLCSDLDFTRPIDEKYLTDVIRFELIADRQREDGIFERLKLDSLIPIEIDLDGEWEFEVSAI